MQRPSPDETEEDLMKQNEAFLLESGKKITPAVKLIKVGKRKTLDASGTDSGQKGAAKNKSRFAEAQSKKKKQGIIDHTIFNEAVKNGDERTTVLKPIVARNVPALNSHRAHWKPMLMPYGFPQAPQLQLLDEPRSTSSEGSMKPVPRKSLYMIQMERERRLQTNDEPKEVGSRKKDNSVHLEDGHLAMLGNQSFILDGTANLGEKETQNIHSENLAKLSEMSHKERLNARDEVISSLDPQLLQYIQSLRKKKPNSVEMEAPDEQMDVFPSAALDKEMNNVIDCEGKMDEEREELHLPKEDESKEWKESETKSVEFEEEVSFSDLPIPPQEAKKWMHMKKVELDKLKWTTEVPPPKPLKGKEGYVARFSFQGDLLPYDAGISWREGLHHHGLEPGRAGYSLDELFLFVRSQVVQQRHLGLKTLANILRNAAEGLYDSCFETPVIQLMIDAGLVLLLRFSMDETSALVYQEALRALYFLVSSEPDERCLALAEPTTPLSVQPGVSSRTHSKEKDREELDAEEKDLKDIEIIKLDVIRALVRMDVHVRIRYLLESVSLSPPDVLHILGILRRIARHSLTAAWTLVATPRLLAAITTHFLPHNTNAVLPGSNVDRLTSIYGVPLSQALSFMKVLASRGRQIASKLLTEHDLMSRILAYVSLEPTEVQMPLTEVLCLAQESYGLWSLFLSYGLSRAQQAFSTFYPLFVKQLLFYRDKVDLNDKIESNQYNYEIGAHMSNVLRKGLCVASTKSLLVSKMKNNEASVTDAGKKPVVLQPPILDWKDFEEIVTLSEICLEKWANQLARNFEVSFSGLKLIGSFCNFLNAYFTRWRDQPSFEGVHFANKMHHTYSKIVLPLLRAEACDHVFKGLRKFSALCATLKLGKSREPFNLGSLGSVCEGGQVTPILQTGSPFPFLVPFLNLLHTMCTLHPALDEPHITSLLNNEHLKVYLNVVCRSKHALSSQWFTRFEIYAISSILHLASLKSCDDYMLYHRTALTIISLVHKGDEHIVKSLLMNVVCNVDFIKDISEIESRIQSLSVNDYKPLKSPATAQPIISHIELTQRLVHILPSIGENFVKNILHSQLLEKSVLRYNCIPFLINNLSADIDEDVLLLDPYWCLSPLKLLLHLNDAKSDEAANQSNPETLSSVTKWLQMTFLLLKHRKSVTVAHTNPQGWYRHLSNVFLASSDLFLDVNISSYTQASLATILEEDSAIKELDWSLVFPDLLLCFDWYKRMVEHYSGVSYGDSSFALFLIIPLLRRWPQDYKLLLFGEHLDELPFIRLSVDDVSQFISMEHFLSPTETDKNVIMKYKSAIANGAISGSRTPFLYQLALYHSTEYDKVNVLK